MPYYVKAYPLSTFRNYSGWQESPGISGPDQPEDDDPIVFLHQDYVVSRSSIRSDQQIVFDKVTEEWIDFCRDQCGFERPGWSEPRPNDE